MPTPNTLPVYEQLDIFTDPGDPNPNPVTRYGRSQSTMRILRMLYDHTTLTADSLAPALDYTPKTLQRWAQGASAPNRPTYETLYRIWMAHTEAHHPTPAQPPP